MTSTLDPILSKAIAQSAAYFNEQGGYAVALSGGPDSAMLAVHAAHWAQQQGQALYFFHIHHGLQKAADGWTEQVLRLGEMLGVPTWVKRVQVIEKGDGVESAARRARYKGLQQMAKQLGCGTILLGHHLDDQAETVVMRLLRGSGPTGMQAMRPLLQRQAVHYVRPFLGVPRTVILQAAQQFKAQTQWQAVTDPTNINPRYTRGIIREKLAPVFDEHWPHWRRALARHAEQAAEENLLLEQWAEELLHNLDFRVQVGEAKQTKTHSSTEPHSLTESRNPTKTYSFCLRLWRGLNAAKQRLVLRHFFKQAALPMPSHARLAEMQRQLNQVHQLGTDRQLQIPHGRSVLRCADARVLLNV